MSVDCLSELEITFYYYDGRKVLMFSYDTDNDISNNCNFDDFKINDVKDKNTFIHFLNQLNNCLNNKRYTLEKLIKGVQEMTYEFDMLKMVDISLIRNYGCEEEKYYNTINFYFDERENSNSSGKIEAEYDY